MSDNQYQIALAAFNAVLRADPICRQLMDDEGRWGDIMYREDAAQNPSGISLFDKMVAQQAALPPPVVQEYRSFPAPSPRMQQQRQQVQRQQVQRQPAPQVQQKPPVPAVQKPQQKKRARNAFADLDDEDSE